MAGAGAVLGGMCGGPVGLALGKRLLYYLMYCRAMAGRGWGSIRRHMPVGLALGKRLLYHLLLCSAFATYIIFRRAKSALGKCGFDIFSHFCIDVA